MPAFCPTSHAPASFLGLCHFSGLGCFPLSGDSLSWCWQGWAEVRLVLFSPPPPPKLYKGFLSQHFFRFQEPPSASGP